MGGDGGKAAETLLSGGVIPSFCQIIAPGPPGPPRPPGVLFFAHQDDIA